MLKYQVVLYQISSDVGHQIEAKSTTKIWAKPIHFTWRHLSMDVLENDCSDQKSREQGHITKIPAHFALALV